MKKSVSGLFIALVLSVLFAGCKEDELPAEYSNITGNYFSIRQYTLDQWNIYSGEPFLIQKTVRVNDGAYDTTYTNSDTLDWGQIFNIFFKTEISDRKFLGKYKFTEFNDDHDETHNYFYEALDDDLYTRKLLIAVDQYTQKVKGIYIEAADNSPLEDKLVKLYYKPMRRIQIQTLVKPVFGKEKHTVTEYEFER